MTTTAEGTPARPTPTGWGLRSCGSTERVRSGSSRWTGRSDRATFRVPELYRGIGTLSAQEAADWGMVARVVPHDELADAPRDVLARSCRTAPRVDGRL